MKPLLKSIHWSLLVVPLAVTLGLAAIGCADLSSTEGTSGIDGATTSGSLPGETTTEVVATATTVASPTTTSGSSTAVSHTPSTNTASESVTTDGHVKACGRITDVWSKDGARKLTIDYVDYLTGAAADAAAVAEGESSAPGGYWVRNKSTKLRTFTVSNSVQITTYSRDGNVGTVDQPCSWADFYNLWHHSGPPAPDDINISDGVGFWWIERDPSTNAIIKIEEQFVS
jgi:hypothetical protein